MNERFKNDPFKRFGEWFAEAEEKIAELPNAMALATATADGCPSVRMVLLKSWDERGFVFYTNIESRKGRELAENAQASLVFYWNPLNRQIRIDGTVAPVSDEQADEYFATRPRDAQIGAWASKQSREMESRFAFEKDIGRYAAKFAVGKVPRPPFWSGFRVAPVRIEFWQQRKFRLHKRELFTRGEDGSWRVSRLYP